MADPRRTFGPTVVVGVAGAGLAAMAGNETWVTGRECAGAAGVAAGSADSPATTAVALALLAAWGVLLVTRGRVRRLVSVLTALLGLGLVATVVAGVGAARDNVRDGVLGLGPLDCVSTQTHGWFWVAVAALPLALLPALVALRHVPSWPEMGRRYDAPVGQEPPATPPEEQENLDLWKAMDEGRDPTA